MFKMTDEEIKEGFKNAQTRKDIADLLEVDDRSLRYFLYAMKANQKYHTFYIPKKNRELREINAPKKELKQLQRKLNYILKLVYKRKPAAYGFLPQISIVDHAQQHNKKNMMLNVDLKDFFHQIHFGRVKGTFTQKPYSLGEEAALVLSQLVCYNKVLPQGAPTSPIISNIVMAPLDTQLERFAKKHRMMYTRYADDITLSGSVQAFKDAKIDKMDIGSQLKHIFKQCGYVINPNKIKLSHYGVRQEVTGLVVNKFPNVRKEYINELRAVLYNAKHKGIIETAKIYADIKCKERPKYTWVLNSNDDGKIYNWFKNVLTGRINFIGYIKGKESFTFIKYAEQCNELFGETIFDIDTPLRRQQQIRQSVVILSYVDDNGSAVQGTGFYLKGYGLVTCAHCINEGAFHKVILHTGKQIPPVFLNSESKNEKIDYCIIKHTSNNSDLAFEIGDSQSLEIGDNVIVIGYPNFQKGDSYRIEHTAITSRKNQFFETELYTVGCRIGHGMSGGPVLNQDYKVIGIIRAGTMSLEEQDDNTPHGFIPIHLMVEQEEKRKLNV